MLLQQYLDEQGYGSRTKLAKKLGVPPDYIHKYINGTLLMTATVAARISAATGIAIVDLLYPDGIPDGAKLLPDGQLELFGTEVDAVPISSADMAGTMRRKAVALKALEEKGGDE